MAGVGIAKHSCLLVLAFAFSCIAHGEDRGVINDPDGYVNVRRSKSTASPVIAKVKQNEPFTFEPDEDMEWCKVTLRSGKKGWMHRSRIRLYFTEAEVKMRGGQMLDFEAELVQRLPHRAAVH